jgi:hypothetical protein
MDARVDLRGGPGLGSTHDLQRVPIRVRAAQRHIHVARARRHRSQRHRRPLRGHRDGWQYARSARRRAGGIDRSSRAYRRHPLGARGWKQAEMWRAINQPQHFPTSNPLHLLLPAAQPATSTAAVAAAQPAAAQPAAVAAALRARELCRARQTGHARQDARHRDERRELRGRYQRSRPLRPPHKGPVGRVLERDLPAPPRRAHSRVHGGCSRPGVPRRLQPVLHGRDSVWGKPWGVAQPHLHGQGRRVPMRGSQGHRNPRDARAK